MTVQFAKGVVLAILHLFAQTVFTSGEYYGPEWKPGYRQYR